MAVPGRGARLPARAPIARLARLAPLRAQYFAEVARVDAARAASGGCCGRHAWRCAFLGAGGGARAAASTRAALGGALARCLSRRPTPRRPSCVRGWRQAAPPACRRPQGELAPARHPPSSIAIGLCCSARPIRRRAVSLAATAVTAGNGTGEGAAAAAAAVVVNSAPPPPRWRWLTARCGAGGGTVAHADGGGGGGNVGRRRWRRR